MCSSDLACFVDQIGQGIAFALQKPNGTMATARLAPGGSTPSGAAPPPPADKRGRVPSRLAPPSGAAG